MQHQHNATQPLAAQCRDEVLAQYFDDDATQGARHQAGRDHRQRDRGQDEMADMHPVPGPFAGSGADRRQPAEQHREDDHEHHAEPVVRHRHAVQRERHGGAVEQRAAEGAGEPAKHTADDEAEHRRRHRQQERIAGRALELVGDQAAVGDRAAEVPLRHMRKPQAELYRQLLVQPVVLAHHRHCLRRRVRRQDRADRITRSDVHEHEAHEAHGERDRNGIDDAAQRVEQHQAVSRSNAARPAGALGVLIRRCST